MRLLNLFTATLLAIFLFTACSEQENYLSTDTKYMSIESQQNSIVERLQDRGFTVEIVKNNASAHAVSCKPEIPTGLICESLVIFDEFPYNGNEDCPGCSEISVNYEVTICYDPVTFKLENQIYFNNFNALPTGDCGELWDCWISMDSDEANVVIEKFLYEVSLIAESRYMEAAIDNFGNVSMVASEFSRQLCYRTCIDLLNRPPFFDFQLQHCGSKCCKRTRQFWSEPSGELFISAPVFEAVGNDSCSDNPIGKGCDFWGTPCFDHPCGIF